jgi:energy-converting hydrogenase Eha subunit F
MSTSGSEWPDLPYAAWRDSCETLQLWTQIVGKIRLARTPWLNHSWHVPLYVTPRGLTTSPIPDGTRTFQIDFDFIDHQLRIATSDGASRQVPLQPQSVARFYTAVMAALAQLGIHVAIDETPNELPQPIRFSQDEQHASYDRDAVRRFSQLLVNADRVFKQFRTAFLGKASPVHFFWGSFDLAVTRFSGRRAPLHPGGVPHLSDEVVREAYSHEVSSAGFWPGGGAIDYPAFYSYAYPEPDGFRAAPLRPTAAFFSKDLGEFVLPYDAVRTASRPDETLLEFLQSTYEAAANAAKWDRGALECAMGRPGQPRKAE